MTTVSVYDHLDLLSALRGWFASDQAVVPREVLFPPSETPTQIQQQNTQEFTSSQDSAIAAALGKLRLPEQGRGGQGARRGRPPPASSGPPTPSTGSTAPR